MIVANPMGLAKGLQDPFVIGQSRVVGGVPTDIVVLADQATHLQIWIGSDDKLPRMDPRRLSATIRCGSRHQVEFTDWKLGGAGCRRLPLRLRASARAKPQ